jgi:V8-like Glu-specific endopeptidase
MVQRRRALGIAAIVALLLAACGSTASPSASGEASASAAASAEATPLTPADLAHAVVQVLMISADGLVGTGSGTIIDPSGLILTNAHVATPSDIQLTELQVGITGATDHPAAPTYDAEVAAADTVLDLAVIRITASLDGSPLPESFPFVQVGDSNALDIGDDISVFGYPGIGGNTITFTSGQVSGFTGEAVLGDRAWIKTDATIAGGNSGGLAANGDGEIIGVPTRSGTTSEIVDCRVIVDTNRDGVINDQDTCVPLGGFINGLRPIAFAGPLITAARGGVAYEPIGGLPEPGGSPLPSQGFDTTKVSFGTTTFTSDVTENDEAVDEVAWLPTGAGKLCAVWTYEGMEAGMSWEAIWSLDGEVQEEPSFLQQTWALEPSGSFWVCITNESGLTPGVYDLALNVEDEFQAGGFAAVGDAFAPVTLKLVNSSDKTICYLYVAPTLAGSWGSDRLGEDLLAPGGSVSFDVPSGHYDLLGRNCDHEDILSEIDVDVTVSKTLTYS